MQLVYIRHYFYQYILGNLQQKFQQNTKQKPKK